MLFPGRAWNLHTRALVNVDREPAAIETLQVRAPKVIGSTDELRGGARDRDPRIPERLGLARDTAACGEEQRQNDRGCIAQAPNLTRSARSPSPVD